MMRPDGGRRRMLAAIWAIAVAAAMREFKAGTRLRVPGRRLSRRQSCAA